MRKETYNSGWKFVKGYLPSLRVLGMQGKEAEDICLPHDAMILEKRTPDTKNGGHTGYYPGGVYTYFKMLDVPQEWSEKHVVLEFEGIYQTAMVYVNGVLAKTNLYGYSNFYVELDPYLNYGEENEIKVVADNASEDNSRWYSGSGIYRNVNLYVGNLLYIPVDGVKITTVDADHETAVIEVCTEVCNDTRKSESVKVSVELLWAGEIVRRDMVHATVFGNAKIRTKQQITVEKPFLWSCGQPNLYECVVRLVRAENKAGTSGVLAGEADRADETLILDEMFERVGIRTLRLDAAHGLRINGELVKLRGTCIHHDNGVIGAATLKRAEQRKCRLLKEAGFNSIRSAHHPADKALLDACDELGILVMDEMCDMWNAHKNNNDFALHFKERWEEIAEAMVKKDYNHPCVIMYSVGNEIPETGTARGAQINRMICSRINELDGTRYTTNAVNGLNAAGARMFPIMQELAPLIKKDVERSGQGDQTGSNALNSFMKLMDGEAGDAFAIHPKITEAIAECCESMDVIGLNYLTGRHVLETKLHPNKCVVGTETFPADIARLWRIVKDNPQVLGDFTWTGYDYIGEAGCGIFYYDGKQNFAPSYPDRLSYIGDIDLNGNRRPISYLREIVYGRRVEPYIAVERMNRAGMHHSKTPWMLKDNVSSWTWHGYEGERASVDVYADAEEVELLLNQKSLGRIPAGAAKDYTASFSCAYEPGILTAVAYENGKETGRYTLVTAGADVAAAVEADRTVLDADGEDLAFVRIALVDKDGVENRFASKRVTIRVNGAGTLQGFGSADPSCEGNYQDAEWETYDGCLLAAVRAGTKPGVITVCVKAEGCEQQMLEIQVK